MLAVLLLIALPVVLFGMAAASLGMAGVAITPLELSWLLSVFAAPIFVVPALALSEGDIKRVLGYSLVGAVAGPLLVALTSLVVWDALAWWILGPTTLDVPYSYGVWTGPSAALGAGYAGLGWCIQVVGLWLATRRRLALVIGVSLAMAGTVAGWSGSSGVLRRMPQSEPILRAEKYDPFLDQHFHMEVEWKGSSEQARRLAESLELYGADPLWTAEVGDGCTETLERRQELWVFRALCE